MGCKWNPSLFDNLDPNNPTNYDPDVSPADTTYNCIGWAIDPDNPQNWWPKKNFKWPKNLLRVETIENFIRAFEIKGYVVCDDGAIEEGFEKIVLYSINEYGREIPKHAARQLPNGKWTSKIGACEDIKHFTPEDVEGLAYGKKYKFMKRPRK